MKNINKKIGLLVIIIIFNNNLLMADKFNLDNYFQKNNDITKNLINDINEKKKKNASEMKEIKKNSIKYVVKENTPPKVYFKQPRVYTIYTREELRSFENVEMVINSGWKTIIVGQHQLVINDEFKIK